MGKGGSGQAGTCRQALNSCFGYELRGFFVLGCWENCWFCCLGFAGNGCVSILLFVYFCWELERLVRLANSADNNAKRNGLA